MKMTPNGYLKIFKVECLVAHILLGKFIGFPNGKPRVTLECGPAQPSLFSNKNMDGLVTGEQLPGLYCIGTYITTIEFQHI
jgi:hypothetical protein